MMMIVEICGLNKRALYCTHSVACREPLVKIACVIDYLILYIECDLWDLPKCIQD